MAAIFETLRRMKLRRAKAGTKMLFFAGLGSAWLLLPASARAQTMPVGSGTNLSSVMYFEPPHEQQIKVRLSGAEMSPLPGVALYDVKKLKIEKFNTNGILEAVAEAPQCTYAPLDETASSPGHLDLTLGGGKIRVHGEGFLWQENTQSLIISNRQQTLINMGNWKLTTP
jgi:hypothetical protein